MMSAMVNSAPATYGANLPWRFSAANPAIRSSRDFSLIASGVFQAEDRLAEAGACRQLDVQLDFPSAASALAPAGMDRPAAMASPAPGLRVLHDHAGLVDATRGRLQERHLAAAPDLARNSGVWSEYVRTYSKGMPFSSSARLHHVGVVADGKPWSFSMISSCHAAARDVEVALKARG
jgi:hypothetical protein